MRSLKNAIEEVVVAEVLQQLSASPEAVRAQIDISEVAAYALNRLPPLYATTQRGWQQQKKRAETELRPQIVQAVEQALVQVRPVPWRNTTLLPVEVIETPADALARLRTIFGMPQLQWHAVPRVILDHLFLHEGTGMSNSDEPTVPLPPACMYKTPPEQRVSIQTGKQMLNQEIMDFEVYMNAATCTFTNALESLVWDEVERQTLRLDALLTRKVNTQDVVAYSLNRLPPMYATSEEGLARQKERALSDLGTAIASTVIQAIMTLSRLPRRIDAPIPLLKFEQEQEEAIAQIRLIAQRDDITWRNLTKLVEDALEASKLSQYSWRVRWQLLGKLYRDLQLQPGDAELGLISEPVGDTLLVQANSKNILTQLTDTPQLLASKALQYFPNLDTIEIWSPLLATTLTYTKAEMILDGILKV
ncbi:MAG: late competence development ComFB family protein [Pseudanabaenaceae cyanobacterium]